MSDFPPSKCVHVSMLRGDPAEFVQVSVVSEASQKTTQRGSDPHMAHNLTHSANHFTQNVGGSTFKKSKNEIFTIFFWIFLKSVGQC